MGGEKTLQNIFIGGLILGAILLALALLIAAINMGSSIAATWVLLVFQVLFTIIGSVVAVTITVMFVSRSIESISDRLEKLSTSQTVILRRFRQHTPAFVAAATLLAQAIMILADKSFDGDPIPTLAISFILLLIFWVANELMIYRSSFMKWIGYFLWFIGILILPIFVMIYFNWDFMQLLSQLSSFDLVTTLFFGLATLALLLLPLLFSRLTDDSVNNLPKT